MENRQGEGKNSIGKVEAKELISMTHELQRGAECGKDGMGRMEWSEGGGEWDNCNSIINKY